MTFLPPSYSHKIFGLLKWYCSCLNSHLHRAPELPLGTQVKSYPSRKKTRVKTIISIHKFQPMWFLFGKYTFKENWFKNTSIGLVLRSSIKDVEKRTNYIAQMSKLCIDYWLNTMSCMIIVNIETAENLCPSCTANFTCNFPGRSHSFISGSRTLSAPTNPNSLRCR